MNTPLLFLIFLVYLQLSLVCSFSPRFLRRFVANPYSIFSHYNQNEKATNTLPVVIFLATLLNTNVPLVSSSAFVTARAESSQELAFDKQEKIRLESSPRESTILTDTIKVPYGRENYGIKKYLGKATLVVNMKLDDPQTSIQYPALTEIFNKYSKDGLNILVFPTEQGYYEPDDDETCRAKAKEYYGFGDYPKAVVFDKVDLLGPSANPFYNYLTSNLATPNGYRRITLNYEKFLLDSNGNPLRRYPRKYSVYDMEDDIKSALNGRELDTEGRQYDLYLKNWKESKREAIKSEYAFRYNYNYYTSPESMYRYKPSQDATTDPNL